MLMINHLHTRKHLPFFFPCIFFNKILNLLMQDGLIFKCSTVYVFKENVTFDLLHIINGARIKLQLFVQVGHFCNSLCCL